MRTGDQLSLTANLNILGFGVNYIELNPYEGIISLTLSYLCARYLNPSILHTIISSLPHALRSGVPVIFNQYGANTVLLPYAAVLSPTYPPFYWEINL